MGMTIDAPFIAHSELTNEIYVIDKKAKHCVTDQVMKAVIATNRAILKDQYEARLKADMVDILLDVQNEIKQKELEAWGYPNIEYSKGLKLTVDIIQKKIRALKENKGNE